MRSILAIALGLSLSAVAFAQDNSSSTKVTQQDLNAVFQTGALVSKKNVLSKQERKETVGGSSCIEIIGGDGIAYEYCW